MTNHPDVGDLVEVPYGFEKVIGRVLNVYGPPGRPHVLLELRLDEAKGDRYSDVYSDSHGADTLTISLPLDKVGRIVASA